MVNEGNEKRMLEALLNCTVLENMADSILRMQPVVIPN